MNKLLMVAALATLACSTSPASAHTLKGSGCGKDGSACEVYCNNGHLAGVMYWNRSVWTDGTRSDPDREAEANAICAVNGTDCE